MIRTDDMLNGEGLRVVLFVSGCTHQCKGCHNPETWDINSGKPFTYIDKEWIFDELKNDYIDGITLSGGDPLCKNNHKDILALVKDIKNTFPSKTIWLYTGYTLDNIKQDKDKLDIVKLCDVLVEGEFIEELADVNYPYAGSTNQNVIYLNNINL